MKNMDIYLDMSDEQLDNLLLGLDLNKKIENNNEDKICKNCKSSNLIIDSAKGHMVCCECAVINEEYLDDNPEINNNENENNNNSRYGCPSSFFYPKASLGTAKNIILQILL